MSIEVMTLAWYVEGITPAQKAVLVALADHADEYGRKAYPAVSRLVVKTSCAERTVRRALADLREMGLIHIEKQSAQHEATTYCLDLPEMHRRINKEYFRPATDAPLNNSDLPESPPDLPENTARPARNAPKPSYNHQEPIYVQPDPYTPFPELAEQNMEMVSVLSGTVKDNANGVKGEARFNQVASELIEQGVTIEQVRAFRDWWAANGYYKGKPSLTSLLQEIENSINGVVKASANGSGRHDYKDYWREVQAEIRRSGRMSKKKWDDTTAKVIRRAGGFPALCNMSFPDAERAFSAAYQDMT